MKIDKFDKWLLIPVIVLAAFFLFRLVDQAQIINQFPLDQNNDIASHIAQLQFLKQYGFHSLVPLWYNGFVLFQTYPPGWYFFTLPLLYLLKNILLTTFISHILLYILAFVFFLVLGKQEKFSFLKTLFFYLIIFANPMSIGNFIKLGRLPELFSFVFFIPLFSFFLYFKNNKLSFSRIAIFTILYSLLILAHPSFFILSFFFFIPLFISKNWKQRTMLAASFILVFLLTLFWFFPFISSSFSTGIMSDVTVYAGLERLLVFNKALLFDNLLSFILPVVLWITFLFYCKSLDKHKMKKEIKFYSLILAFSFLYFSRLAAFIPFLNKPYPDSYHLLFLFLSMLFFLKTDFSRFSGIFKKTIISLLVLLPILFVLISVFFVPDFREHNNVDKEIISLMPAVQGKYFITSLLYPSYAEAYFSYGAVYYNLSTPSGWNPAVAPVSLLKKLDSINALLKDNQCPNAEVQELGIEEVISYGKDCKTLKNCGFLIKEETQNVCLLKWTSR